MRKHFVGKDFESITEMDNLDTVAEEITVAKQMIFSGICVTIGGDI